MSGCCLESASLSDAGLSAMSRMQAQGNWEQTMSLNHLKVSKVYKCEKQWVQKRKQL